uniref:BPTI/Kunitz inhibitor domain-containing protein n=1 Tax=Mesocestoides corti TaxID=53468 RepID=A0A5K3EKE0_MESCO
VCKLRKRPGPCRGNNIRYYYDTETGRCDQFIYGGCRGNANNFLTMEECEAKCGHLA